MVCKINILNQQKLVAGGKRQIDLMIQHTHDALTVSTVRAIHTALKKQYKKDKCLSLDGVIDAEVFDNQITFHIFGVEFVAWLDIPKKDGDL